MATTNHKAPDQTDPLDLADLASCLHSTIAAITQQPEKRLSKSRVVGRFIGGKVAGVTAMSAFYSAVATFGSASTGTAIGSLSGAAATNATLYWIGGLVGGGVAAGTTVMTFGAAAIGAGAIMAWSKFFRTKRRTLDDISLQEKRILCSCDILLRSLETPNKPVSGGVIISLPAERQLFSKYGIDPLRGALASVLFSNQGQKHLKAKLTRKNRKVLTKAYERLCTWSAAFSRTYPRNPSFKRRKKNREPFSLTTFWKSIFKRSELNQSKQIPETRSVASSAIFITIESILESPSKPLDFEQGLVLEAIGKSLRAENTAHLAELLRVLGKSPTDLCRLVSQVKSEFHKLLLTRSEDERDADYDVEHALAQSPRGYDVEYVLQGNRIKSAQIKSVASPNLVHEHFRRYPQINIRASEGVIARVDGLQSDGFKTYVANFKVIERLVEFKSAGFINDISDELVSSSYVIAAVTVHSLLVEKKSPEEALNDALVIAGIIAGGSFITDWISDAFNVT